MNENECVHKLAVCKDCEIIFCPECGKEFISMKEFRKLSSLVLFLFKELTQVEHILSEEPQNF